MQNELTTAVEIGGEMEAFVAHALDCELGLDAVERAVRRGVVVCALKRAQWNQCQAARALGIHRNTLGRIMREEGIAMPDWKITPDWKRRIERIRAARERAA